MMIARTCKTVSRRSMTGWLNYSTTRSTDDHHQRETSIGFIGLGAMGLEMASNLLTKSPRSPFVIHDQSESSVARFMDRHRSDNSDRISIAKTPSMVAKSSSTIVTMLPSTKEVSEVYLHPDTGLRSGLKDLREDTRMTLCIDSTTLDLTASSSISSQLQHEIPGFEMIDAPVSGGVVGAKDSTLTFMCGGSLDSFHKAQVYLNLMGKKSIYCGKSGSGLAAKLTNNMLLAVSMVATSEAMLLGERLGLDRSLLASVINSSTGRCWSSEINNPAPGALLPAKTTPADRDWAGGFASKLMAKDLGLALDAAGHQDSSLPLSKLVNEIYCKLNVHPEFSSKDFSVVYDWLRKNS
ncbi:hypothetical protein PSTG_01895 [Puccinia striiformis f. sp. tritici PST-78]|uniref:3-hydroxyisobutyrate dehydrogenase n=1 Tax=Puccinia striiformis f. sp. tritici PST-78 TaxID=1165861 RepID=A0A0L0VZZ3_9BASI|nr:hypothetical protein PSTG_01895 [Puccinia striiformis f. sp. tritici PST-78]